MSQEPPIDSEIQRPVAPIRFDPERVRNAPVFADPGVIAQRLQALRPEMSLGEFERQVRSPIASRIIAVYVEIDMPDLGRSMIFDTRVDNPGGMPPSLRDLPASGPGSPWPSPPPPQKAERESGPVVLGHSGSSCPGYLSGFMIAEGGNNIEIPVEILGFHVEGRNGECAYSITMYSEVLGRVSAALDDPDHAQLNMWGKMMITLRPHNPQQYGGQELIQMVSRDYVRQSGTITGFPPHSPGEYIESSGDDVYIGVGPGQAHLSAIIRRGRIIFSTDVDEFLQARTRISEFTLLDTHGEPLDAGPPPYDPSLIGRIGGVRLRWSDIRTVENMVTHYRLYRLDPDTPQAMELLSGQLLDPEFVDTGYDGTRSYAYAIVPACVDQVGMEVQGISVDHGMLMAIEPSVSAFDRRNFGVGHIRWM